MTKRVKMCLSIVVVLIMLFTIAIPATAAPTTHRISGHNPVFLGTSIPEFVVFSDGQVGTVGGGQNIVVWTPDGTGDWNAIKAGIIAAGQAPGWLENGNYAFHGFFSGVGFTNGFYGQQNHIFSVEQVDGRWYATKRNLAGNISGTISNTIFYGDLGQNQPQVGALAVTVGAEQTSITTTRVETWQRTYRPTYTLTKYVSQNFGSVTATTPAQWALRNCPTVINTRNGNPIHPNNRNAGWYNPLTVFNANHFVFASLCYATLAAGGEIPLVLVVGNNYNPVGDGVVTLADGYLTITFDYALFSGSWGAISFNNMLGVPNNGNIHSIGGNHAVRDMAAIGASTSNGFSHSIRANTVTIPAAAPTAAGNIYLYIHGSFTFLRDYNLAGPVNVLTREVIIGYENQVVSITNPLATDTATIVVRNAVGAVVAESYGSSLNIADLLLGDYTVTVSFAGQTQEQVVTITAGTTSVSFNFTLADIHVIGGTVRNYLPPIMLPPVTNTVIVRR